jgi:hypothetical protein
MSCHLSIYGRNFDVDAFVEISKLKRAHLSRKGQPRFKTLPEKGTLPYSVLSVTTSNAGFDELKPQIADTMRYLKRHRQKLEHITHFKGIEGAALDFGLDLKIDGDRYLTQSIWFPPGLVQLAGSLGIGIQASVYHPEMQGILERKRQKKLAVEAKPSKGKAV